MWNEEWRASRRRRDVKSATGREPERNGTRRKIRARGICGGETEEGMAGGKEAKDEEKRERDGTRGGARPNKRARRSRNLQKMPREWHASYLQRAGATDSCASQIAHPTLQKRHNSRSSATSKKAEPLGTSKRQHVKTSTRQNVKTSKRPPVSKTTAARSTGAGASTTPGQRRGRPGESSSR